MISITLFAILFGVAMVVGFIFLVVFVVGAANVIILPIVLFIYLIAVPIVLPLVV